MMRNNMQYLIILLLHKIADITYTMYFDSAYTPFFIAIP